MKQEGYGTERMHRIIQAHLLDGDIVLDVTYQECVLPHPLGLGFGEREARAFYQALVVLLKMVADSAVPCARHTYLRSRIFCE